MLTHSRQLAAVLLSDIAGYKSLMHKDVEPAFWLLQQLEIAVTQLDVM